MGKRFHRSTLAGLIKRAFPSGTPKTRTYTIEGAGLVSNSEAPITIRPFRIFWGIPCDEIGFSNFWIRFEGYANRMPWDGFAGSEGTYLPKARNIIHDAFLDSSKDFLALMMLDSDILFPPNLIDRLLEHNLPIVGGWYRDKKAPNHHPCVYDFLSEDDKGVASWNARPAPGTGLERVDGMGAGCWLMKREVAEALGRSPYDLNSGGEDMKISRKLMNLGIPLYVDWTLNCAHAGVGIT